MELLNNGGNVSESKKIENDVQRQEDLMLQVEGMLENTETVIVESLKLLAVRREELAKEAGTWLVKQTSTSRFTQRLARQKYWQCINAIRDINREIRGLTNGTGNGLGGVLTRGL